MKKLSLFLLSVYGCYFLGQFIAQKESVLNTFFQGKNTTTQFFINQQFKPAQYPIINHNFTIAIIGQNNGAGVDKTLKSAIFQNYNHFRIIYVDDASSDGSLNQAQNVIDDCKTQSKVTIIQNPTPLGFLQNLVKIANLCNDDEILVLLGDEDLLAHEWVLHRLNQYYADPDLWMTLSLFLQYPSYTTDQNLQNIDLKNLRSQPLGTQNLKTFYAGLLKKMDPNDLTYNATFMPDSIEISYLLPLLEMAEDHVTAINEVMYISKKNIRKEEPLHQICENHVLSQAPYAPLPNLFQTFEHKGPL